MFVFINNIKEIKLPNDSEAAKKAMSEDCTPKTMRKLMQATQSLRNQERTQDILNFLAEWPCLYYQEFFRFDFKLLKNLKNFDSMKNKLKRALPNLSTFNDLLKIETLCGKFTFVVFLTFTLFY